MNRVVNVCRIINLVLFIVVLIIVIYSNFMIDDKETSGYVGGFSIIYLCITLVIEYVLRKFQRTFIYYLLFILSCVLNSIFITMMLYLYRSVYKWW